MNQLAQLVYQVPLILVSQEINLTLLLVMLLSESTRELMSLVLQQNLQQELYLLQQLQMLFQQEVSLTLQQEHRLTHLSMMSLDQELMQTQEMYRLLQKQLLH